MKDEVVLRGYSQSEELFFSLVVLVLTLLYCLPDGKSVKRLCWWGVTFVFHDVGGSPLSGMVPLVVMPFQIWFGQLSPTAVELVVLI